MLLEGVLAAVALTAAAILPVVAPPLRMFVNGGANSWEYVRILKPSAVVLAAVVLVLLLVTILPIVHMVGRFVIVKMASKYAGPLRNPYVTTLAIIAYLLASLRTGAPLMCSGRRSER